MPARGLATAQTPATFLVLLTAACCGASDTASPTSNQQAGAQGDVWFEETWSYPSLAALRGAAHISWIAENNGSVTLVGGQSDAPWGGVNAVQARVNGGYSNVGIDMDLPGANGVKPRELWMEFYIKFTSDWNVVSVPEQTKDHKTIFFLQPGGYHRWEIHVRGEDVRFHINDTNWDEGYAFPNGDADVFDGRWHRWRVHLRQESPGGQNDGTVEMWFDDLRILSHVGTVNSDDAEGNYFSWLALGRNGGFEKAASMYWGRVRAWHTDPGW